MVGIRAPRGPNPKAAQPPGSFAVGAVCRRTGCKQQVVSPSIPMLAPRGETVRRHLSAQSSLIPPSWAPRRQGFSEAAVGVTVWRSFLLKKQGG
jgi:hypothetical protein